MAHYSLQDIQVKDNILDDPKYDYLFTVEGLNELVSQGIPFRDAYKLIAQQVEEGTFQSCKKTSHTHEGSINNLCLEEIKMKMESNWNTY